MIKAIIIDLDDTLIDTTEQLSESWKKALCRVLTQRTGQPLLIVGDTVERFIKEHSYTAKYTKACCEHFNLNPVMISEEIYRVIDLSSLQLSHDAKKFLGHIQGYEVYLVTTGSKILQGRKLQHLGLRFHFIELYDESEGGNKAPLFKKVLQKYRPEEAICIGDNIRSEISAANSLGIRTIRILKGKRKDLQPANYLEKPVHTVHTLMEAAAIIQHIQKQAA
ncbi:HAD family hydrolase [Candidatus Woesearchaeota archaeon]|nr:HAD family hydrolase [Candidatus Woesearchaeota archaeon]